MPTNGVAAVKTRGKNDPPAVSLAAPESGRPVSLAAEVERLKAENDKLRAKLGNSREPCAYCGIPADRLLECRHGFPGCPRADDMVLCGHFGAAWEAAQMREALAAERRKGGGAAGGAAHAACRGQHLRPRPKTAGQPKSSPGTRSHGSRGRGRRVPSTRPRNQGMTIDGAGPTPWKSLADSDGYALEVARADENAEARAYIESLERDAARWQPIETALGDGALLLLACSNWPHSEVLGKPVPIKVGGYWDGRWNVFGASWEPTTGCRYPLPQPPCRSEGVRDGRPRASGGRGEGLVAFPYTAGCKTPMEWMSRCSTTAPTWQPLHENRATDAWATRCGWRARLDVRRRQPRHINQRSGGHNLRCSTGLQMHGLGNRMRRDIYAATRRAIVAPPQPSPRCSRRGGMSPRGRLFPPTWPSVTAAGCNERPRPLMNEIAHAEPVNRVRQPSTETCDHQATRRTLRTNPMRWAALALDRLQTGYMMLVRAVAQPSTF